MLKHYALVPWAAVVTGLLLGCGNSEPKTQSNKTDLKTIEQPSPKKEDVPPKANTAKAKPKKVEPAPEPPWLVTLTSGAKLNAFLRPEGEGHFFLGRAGRFSGLYALRGNRLVMEKPVDQPETGFEWEARGADEYALVAQRPGVDNNYVGAILKRVKDDETTKPTP